jgi:hypothetical protein
VPQSRVASQEVIKMLGTNVNPEARNVDAAQQWRKGHDHDCGDRNKIGPRTLRHETYKRGLTTPETCCPGRDRMHRVGVLVALFYIVTLVKGPAVLVSAACKQMHDRLPLFCRQISII